MVKWSMVENINDFNGLGLQTPKPKNEFGDLTARSKALQSKTSATQFGV